MGHDLSFMAGRCQLDGYRLGAVPVVLWPDPDPVQPPGLGLQLTQKGGESLLTQVCRESLGVGLIRETAELDGPHARRRYRGQRPFADRLCLTLRRKGRWLFLSNSQSLDCIGGRMFVFVTAVTGRHRLRAVALEHDFLYLSGLVILAGQRDQLGDDLGISGRAIEEYGNYQDRENHEYSSADDAFFESPVH